MPSWETRGIPLIYLPLIGNSAKSTSRSRKDHMWSNASTLLTEGIPLVSLASYQFLIILHRYAALS